MTDDSAQRLRVEIMMAMAQLADRMTDMALWREGTLATLPPRVSSRQQTQRAVVMNGLKAATVIGWSQAGPISARRPAGARSAVGSFR
jgi:hypothetical protein